MLYLLLPVFFELVEGMFRGSVQALLDKGASQLLRRDLVIGVCIVINESIGKFSIIDFYALLLLLPLVYLPHGYDAAEVRVAMCLTQLLLMEGDVGHL